MITHDEVRRLNRSADLMVKRGVILPEILDQAMDIQAGENGSRRRLGEILVDDLGCDRHAVYRELANIYAFREVDLDRETLSEDRLQFIRGVYEGVAKGDREELLNNNLLAYRSEPGRPDTLLVLSDDPTDRRLPELVKKFKYRNVELGYARRETLSDLKAKIFPVMNEFLQMVQETSNQVESVDLDGDEDDKIDEDKLSAEVNRSLLINLIEGALVEAVHKGASDIHILPGVGNSTEIHFRIDGKLQLWWVQENVRPEYMAAVAKDRSRNIDRFEREAAQDGFMQRTVDGNLIRYRVSVLPVIAAEYRRRLESIVIRVLDDRKVITDLTELGLDDQARNDFEKSIHQPQGLVILTGPTGSGKSTTLYAALSRVINPQVNVLTVEDPVEYMIHGARQIKIGPHLEFEGALRSILRHDPDIVMVGEIRDRITADIAIKLANTGHLTFSTLHTNDAPSAISRLYKMGVEPFLIAYAINLVLAQRLIRTLCPKCKQVDRDLDLEVPLSLGFTEEEIRQTIFYKPVGCDFCIRGYKGRTAISEALRFNKEIRRLILESGAEVDEDAVRREAARNGMLTLRASGRERIKKGQTTCEEVGFATADE